MVNNYRNVRYMMRGYRILKKSDNLLSIRKLKRILINSNLKLKSADLSLNWHFFYFKLNELSVRQYLMYRLGGEKFNSVLLESLGGKKKIAYPLPVEWRMELESQGYQIDKFWAPILWQGYILHMWLFGVYKFFRVFLRNIIGSDGNNYSKSYVFFAGLSSSNIPKNDSEIPQFNIVSWWLKWSRNNREIQTLLHTVPDNLPILIDGIEIKSASHFLPKLKGISLNAKYFLGASYLISRSFINLLSGSWHNAFMLNQYADLIHAQLVNPKDIAKQYFFHNSDWIYRPLWTYGVEATGAEVYMYFYSTNCEPLKHNKVVDNELINLFTGMSWPNYLVWDDDQAQFLLKTLGDKVQYEIVGPIWFSDSDKGVPQIPDNSVMIFDVEPFRASVYQSYCFDIEYYVSDIAKQFILDIYDVLSSHDLNMVLKRKRDIGNKSSKSYTKILDDLEKQDNFITVDPGISAFRLIKTNTNLVISMPYTSTAQIAKSYGLVSIYYDPSGLLLKDDSISHGVPLVSGKDELITWFKNYLNV